MQRRGSTSTQAPAVQRLSKTRYQWGLQCEKRLWLDSRHRELATPPDAGLRARLKQGHRVGELARRRWPDAVLVREPASRHERAEATTAELMADTAVAAICEGAFSFDNIRVRVDVLVRNQSTFDLVEVKSTTRVKPEHASDAGVQLRVLEGAGVAVGRVGVLHLNRDYCWGGGDYDLDSLFTLEDVSAAAREAAARVDDNAAALRRVLSASREPDKLVGRHCRSPYECPFYAHCWREIDYHHVCELPAADAATLDALAIAGITDIAEIDRAGLRLEPADELAHRSVVSGRAYVDEEGLAGVLDDLEYPISCLSVAFARLPLPMFEGTSPYQPLPIAWALSTLAADGAVVDTSFMVDDANDPRPQFHAALARALPDGGTVVVYEPADLDLLRESAKEFEPTLAKRFATGAITVRPLVEAHYYDAAMAGSFAVEAVRAALLGGAPRAGRIDVSAAFGEWIAKGCKPAKRAVLGTDLRETAETGRDQLSALLGGLFAAAEGESPD